MGCEQFRVQVCIRVAGPVIGKEVSTLRRYHIRHTSSMGSLVDKVCSGALRRSSMQLESVTTTHQPNGVGTLKKPAGHWTMVSTA